MADKGNKDYSDKGQRRHPGDTEIFSSPEGVKRFAGYGADEEDLQRGFVEPTLHDDPRYDLQSYNQRWTEPKVSDDDSPETMQLPVFEEFRMKDRMSKGTLIRPRIPTDR